MYVSDARSITPDLQDNLSECGSLPENKHIRATKVQYYVCYTTIGLIIKHIKYNLFYS